MWIERVVLNSSPLIALCRSGQEHLFSRLFTPLLQKSRVPQLQGAKGEAVVLYRPVLAKRRGLIASIKEPIQRLIDSGLYLSDEVVQVLLSEAGE